MSLVVGAIFFPEGNRPNHNTCIIHVLYLIKIQIANEISCLLTENENSSKFVKLALSLAGAKLGELCSCVVLTIIELGDYPRWQSDTLKF